MKTLFFNGKVLFSEPENPRYVLVDGNTITYVGNEQPLFAYEACNKVDLQGKILLPAFIDTHTHFFELARKRVEIDLSPAKNLTDVAEILEKVAKNKRDDLYWLGGSGWNKNIYPDAEKFNRYFLDKYFPSQPVVLNSKDFHTILCNSKALELSGIVRSSNAPQGGRIGKFGNGEPDGFLYEKAWDLIRAEEMPEQIKEEVVKKTVQDCYRLGLAGVHVMENESKFGLYEKLVAAGMNFRFCWHFPAEISAKMIESGITSYSGSEYLKYGGQKIFMDGSIGSHSALMYDAYPDGSYGNSIFSEEELKRMVEEGAKHDIASSVHAIGDRCVHIVANVLAESKERYPHIFHRIEHLQAIDREDISRVAKAGIYAAMQSVHIAADVRNIKKNWQQAERKSYLFKTLLANNVMIGNGSDAPVESINPFLGIYSAITRKYEHNPQEESWLPAERISSELALKTYTVFAAYASQSQRVRGQIKCGYLADLLVIDDFYNQPDEFWLTAESKLTLINGEAVYT